MSSDQVATRQIAPARHSSILWVWVKQETLLLFREPMAVFFSLAFPLIIYAFIGTAYAEEDIGDGIRLIDVMFPALVGTVVANLCLMGIPIYLGELRARDVLRRYRSLPMPPHLFILAVLCSLATLFVMSTFLLAAVVGWTYGLQPGVVSFGFISLLLALLAWLSGFGFFLGTIPAKVRTIQTISVAAFFIMFFGSGAAVPLDGLPDWLEAITRVNPLRHWFDGIIGAYLGQAIPASLMWRMSAVLPATALLTFWGFRNLRREVQG